MTDKKQMPPREIPTHKHPDQQQPVKDPDLSPSKQNPINPETDEPTKQK